MIVMKPRKKYVPTSGDNILVFQESKTRSLLKSATWRVIGITTGAAVVYIYTDNIGMSAAIAIWCNVIGFILYYVHERLWGKVKWGIK